MMTTKTKIRLLRKVQQVFPIWSLRRQRDIIYKVYESDLVAAKGNQEATERLRWEQFTDYQEYEQSIRVILSHKLSDKANDLYIYVPDLNWLRDKDETLLDDESLYRLRKAIQEHTDKRADFLLKLIAALTGLSGAVIGLLAFLYKK